MAKRTGEVNKSEAIRNYLAKRPKATAAEVVPALAEDGIVVTPGLVSNVKHAKKTKGGKRGRRAATATTQASAARKTRGRSLSAGDLLQVKKFAKQVGGIAQLRSALEILEKLR